MTIASFHGGDVKILYSKDDYKRIRNLFTVHRNFFIFMAQIPPKIHHWLPSWMKRVGNFITVLYCITMIGQTSHLAVLFIKTTIDMLEYGEMQEITDSLTMAIIYSFSCFATCYFLIRYKTLVELLDSINRKYHHHSMAGITFVSAHRAYNISRKLILYWQSCCIGGVVLWALAPIILRVRLLPLKCWYPFDAMQPGVYEIIYVLQFLGQVNVGTTFGNGSALFACLAIIMLGQFDVLFCSLKNIIPHAKLLSGEDLTILKEMQNELPLPEDSEVNQYTFATEYKTDLSVLQRIQEHYKQSGRTLEDALHESLVECVQLHRFILNSCKTIENLFNPYCLIKSLQATGQLCLLVFVGVSGERSTVRIINLIQYISLTFSELLMFTYTGQLLQTQSSRVGEAFWRSEWYTIPTTLRKDLLIFLTNSKHAVIMTAGKFFDMDLNRMRSMIMQAFSFLTLLRKLSNKNNK